jgi:hypothetical protein
MIPIVGVCGIRRMRERRVDKKGGMIKWLGENGGELEQIRFFRRLHRGCSGRGSRML